MIHNLLVTILEDYTLQDSTENDFRTKSDVDI